MSQVFGENQPRTRYFRDSLSKDKVIVNVSPEKISNIVHTVTVKDAIMKCLDKKSIPGIYSLVNNPQWTWKDVFEYYNKKTQIEFKPPTPMSKNSNDFLWKMIKLKPLNHFLQKKLDLVFSNIYIFPDLIAF